MKAGANNNQRQLVGSFFFRDEGDGCITGKYFNTGLDSPLVEASKFLKSGQDTNHFCGIYNTIWLDLINEPSGLVELEIRIKPNSSTIYLLRWYNPKNHREIYFLGEGMLVNDLLVGCYWNLNVTPDGY